MLQAVCHTTSLTQNTNNIILSRYTRNRNLLLYNFVTRLLSLLEFLSTRSVYLIVLLHIWFIYILSPDYVVYPPNNCLFDFRFSSFLFSPLFFSIYYTTSLRYIYSDIYIYSDVALTNRSIGIERDRNASKWNHVADDYTQRIRVDRAAIRCMQLDSIFRCARVYVCVVVQLERRW